MKNVSHQRQIHEERKYNPYISLRLQVSDYTQKERVGEPLKSYYKGFKKIFFVMVQIEYAFYNVANSEK